jgi:DeoR/GlpR family transcriptional regulator of sugar metabolism
MIAQYCLDSPHIEVFMPGGKLRRDSISLVEQPDDLPTINLTRGFFGAHGIASISGITESTQEEVEMKQAMMARCLAVYFLVDSSKWGRVAPFPMADPTTHDDLTIITPATAPAELVQWAREQGYRIVTP